MAVSVETKTVGTTAVSLAPTNSSRGYTINFTTDPSVTVYVGGSTVTSADGRALKVNTEYVYDSSEGDLYAVVASGSVDIDVLYTGVSG